MTKAAVAMFSLKNVFPKDPVGTLRKVASLGYYGVELFNHAEDSCPGIYAFRDLCVNMTTKEYKKIMDDLGLVTVGYQPVCKDPNDASWLASIDTQKRLIDFCVEVGSESVALVCELFHSTEFILKRCEMYNKFGELCNEAGIDLVYHNHWTDFIQFDGKNAFDMVLENTESHLVKLEIDVYWTLLGMEDPVKMIRKYGSRVAMAHEKDFPLAAIDELNVWKTYDRNTPIDFETFHKYKQPHHFCEIGEGIIKVQDVINALNEVGGRYLIVEQDFTQLDEIESIKVSANNFRKMYGITLRQ